MEPSHKKILVVDDDADTRGLMSEILTSEGYEVYSCSSAEQAVDALGCQSFDLVLADIRMPGMTGIGLLAEVDKIAPETKVILVTAYASVQTAIAAVRGHAFDYLMKPFAPHELRRQVARAMQPRPSKESPPAIQQLGDLTVDRDARRVWVRDEEVRLTRQEFEVLAYLLERRDSAVSYQELIEKVWECDNPEEAALSGIKSCIYRLRKKIEDDPNAPRYILNVWGVGYRFGI